MSLLDNKTKLEEINDHLSRYSLFGGLYKLQQPETKELMEDALRGLWAKLIEFIKSRK